MEGQTSFSPQEREGTNRLKDRDEGSVRSSIFSAKPSESGYGSATASVRSGQDQSKSGSGSGSGTGSSKSKSLNSDSASASTINSSEDCPKSTFGKDSHKKRCFKSLKPPTPIAPALTEDSKAADFQSSLSQGQKTPSRKKSRALQAVALSRALDCIQNISHVPGNVDSEGKETVRSVLLNPETAKKVAKEVKLGLKEKGRDWRALLGPDIVTDMSQSFAFLEKDPAVKRKDCFITAISLDTGCVVYVTSSMTEKLLFHTDMWTGRSLLDFLHPKDRLVFTNHVTSGLMGSPASSALTNSEIGDPTKQNLCVRFRLFKSFKSSGFAITEKKTSYAPFKLNLKVHKEKCDGELGGSSGSEQLYMLIQATPIHSAYSHSDQTFSTGQFSLRHTSSSAFNEIDSASIPLLGHLPQDLIGTSALDFYLPADLGIVRDTYTAVLQRQGKPVRSMPFHFLAQNGCYVLLETDWSCFINPWSKKLEFVVGNHRVVKGPSNPDVFASPPDPGGSSVLPLSEESLKLISEIRGILGGNAPICSPKRREQEAVGVGDPQVHRRRRRELAILMGTLLDEVTRAQTAGSARSNSGGSPLCDLSVVLGEISPHRGSSPESFDTPVSYSQLNYNENIERYFLSQPKLVPSESSEEKGFGKMNSSRDNSNTNSGGTTSNEDQSLDKETRSAESSSNTKCYSGQAKDSQSQLLSSENNSASGSGEMRQSVLSGNKENYHGPELTTETLQRHSAEMERDFMEQAKVIRLRSLGRDRTDRADRRDSRAVKRGVGSSWDDGSGGDHQFKHPNNAVHHLPTSFPTMGLPLIPVTLWPPFSISATAGHYPTPVYTTTSHGNDSFSAPVAGASTVPTQACMPSYYLSQPSGSATPQVMPQLYMQHQGPNLGMPYMGGMMAYQPMYIPQTYMLSSVPFAPPANTVDDQWTRETVPVERCGTSCQGTVLRCGSQATSVKAEQGSKAPSNASFIARKDVGTAEHAASDYQSVDEGPRDPAELDSWSNSVGYRCMQEGSDDHSHRMDEYMKGESELSDSSGNGLWQDSGRQVLPPIRSTPPWMQSVKSTPDLVYRYQVPSGPSLAEVLERDRASLQQLHQPGMLNDQLVALYREFDDEEMQTRMLNIEEGGNTTSSSCPSGEEQSATHKKKPRRRDDFRRSMIYEENASLPAPDSG